jgi:GT2 family glycosyltransferase
MRQLQLPKKNVDSKIMTAIVILNWNGWKDTILCLESVFQLKGERFSVIVCDNGSTDGSLEKIEEWAQGKLPIADAELKASPIPLKIGQKPISYKRLDRTESEYGELPSVPLILIETGGNLGFGGGSNVGIRYALRDPQVSHVWLLNNDTVVHPEALSALLERRAAGDGPGMVGSTLYYFAEPDIIQAQGGAHWDPTIFNARHIGVGARRGSEFDQASVESQMDYVVGASMLVSLEFLEQIGLMEERYFLYFEELDWAIRARGRFKLGYASGSWVFHKEGSKIGTSHRGAESPLSFYLLDRNRLWIVRRYWTGRVWRLRLRMMREMLTFARRRQFYKVRLLAYVLIERQPAELEIPAPNRSPDLHNG